MQIYGKRKGRLTEAVEQRRHAEELWYVQVDAAAKVGAEVDGGGGASKLGDARKTKQKGTKGKKK